MLKPDTFKYISGIKIKIKDFLYWICERINKSKTPEISIYYAWPDFSSKANAVFDLLRSEGLPVKLISGSSLVRRAMIKSSPDLWIGFWNEYPTADLPKHYIFYNAEPLEVPKWRENPGWTQAMKDSLEVWGYKSANKGFVEEIGKKFRFVPFGFAPYYRNKYNENIHGKSLNKIFDVLFVGGLSDRRKKKIDEIIESGINVKVVSRRRPLYGRDLDLAIARSKIILIIHQYDDNATHVIDLARLDQFLSNGCFVIHEEIRNDPDNLELSRKIITCKYEEMGHKCRYYLENETLRKQHEAASSSWFMRNYSMKEFLPLSDLKTYYNRILEKY